jgi:hypothetical protein
VSFRRVAQGHRSVSASPQDSIAKFGFADSCGDAVLTASAELGQQEPKIKPMGQHFVACAPFPLCSSHYGERFVHLETKDQEQIHDSSAVLNLRRRRSNCSKT